MNWITCTNLRYDRWICLYIFLIEPALSDLFVSVLVILFLSILLCFIPKSTFSAFLLSKTCNANAILAYVSLASVDASITFNNILHSILSVIFCFLWCSFFILSDGPDGAASWTELKLFEVAFICSLLSDWNTCGFFTCSYIIFPLISRWINLLLLNRSQSVCAALFIKHM